MARLSGMRASPLLVALLACAALLSLLHLPLSVRSAAPPAQVVVGVVMPFTGTDSGQGLRAKVDMHMHMDDGQIGLQGQQQHEPTAAAAATVKVGDVVLIRVVSVCLLV